MYRLVSFCALVIFLLVAAGCSTHPSVMNYDGIDEFKIQPGSIEAKEIGEVKGRHRSYVWEGCGYAVRTAVWKMINEAKQRDANAVGEVRWRDGESPEPRCKKRWFYAIIPPLLLTRYFMDAEVCGTAYVVDEDEIETGMYRIPDDPAGELRLAERIAADLLRGS
jgi:hypothetical protein